MLLEAETNKYCPGGNDIGAISNLITWVLNFFLSACKETQMGSVAKSYMRKGFLIYEEAVTHI